MVQNNKSPIVGKVRPSAAVSIHGPGSVVDLPELSVIMMGLEHWWPDDNDAVPEPRLEQFLEVSGLYAPPQPGPGKFGGVPASLFPEFLVCPHKKCRKLAHFSNFSQRKARHGSGVTYFCQNDVAHPGIKQNAFTARFMIACPKGHISDFPWRDYVHKQKGATCTGQLQLVDTGNSGTVADLVVKCSSCGKRAERSMRDAFKKGEGFRCNGGMPWISNTEFENCDVDARTLLRGASNAYFSVMASAITIPPWSNPIHADLLQVRGQLKAVDSKEKLVNGINGGFYDLGSLTAKYTIDEIWEALSSTPTRESLRMPEWRALTKPDGYANAQVGYQFETHPEPVPQSFEGQIAQVVAVTRLREVRALRGFTRIDVVPETGDDDVSAVDVKMARLTKDRKIGWLPAVDLRGEGIFVRFEENGPKGLIQWESRSEVVLEGKRLAAKWGAWRKDRGLDELPFPGMRKLLIHSFAHCLIRQLALDSGYSSASIRERLYVSNGDQPMAGVLFYTASNDSDGSLGGLVDQARPSRFLEILFGALQEASLCSQDPLCGTGESSFSSHINGSACHACLLIAETSCEAGNRLLDRSLLVPTVGRRGLEFFDQF